ncbi:E3 ubiquitin/ISG15 ligase TRIM25-like [Mantella aurantiaca]
MASLDPNYQSNCSSCLEPFSDLIGLSCGHNFCHGCFDHLQSTQEQTGGDTCPACTCVFPAKPVEQQHLQLDIKSESEKDRTKENPKTSDIFCTYCISPPVPAIQSCLHCEASLCAVHLQVHTKSPEHILTKPTDSFKDSKCSIHNNVLDFYCYQDNLCICISCHLEEHRRHQVCDFYEAFAKLKNKLEYSEEILTSEAEEIKTRVQHLQDHKKNLLEKAADVAERVCALFRNIKKQQLDLERKILSDISWQEKQISNLVSNQIQYLEQKQVELCRTIVDIKELYENPEPYCFSQWLKSENSDLHKLKQASSLYRKEDVHMAISLMDFDEGPIFQTLHTGLLDIVTNIQKGIYVQEASDLLLDVNTAANNVAITKDLKELSCPGDDQCRIDKEERFDFSQVLSTRTFYSGRHYWDVEVSDSGDFRIGVAYSTIKRKGGQARIGNNDNSWCLAKEDNKIYFVHDKHKRRLEWNVSCQKIRIYIDYEAGQISFYKLNDSIRHLNTFSATFTKAVHAAFCVFLTSWVRILS